MSSIVVDTKQSIPVRSSCVPTVSTSRYLLNAAPYSEPIIGTWGMKCECQLLRRFGHAPESPWLVIMTAKLQGMLQRR